jgi:hypothetical protein
MSEPNRTWEFNTYITGLPEDGKWDDERHHDIVKPMWLFIKGHDGVTKCYISQANIVVHFFDHITDLDTVERIVQEAMDRFRDEDGFFPVRGDKTPTATRKKVDADIPPDPNQPRWIYFDFGSHAVPYQVNADDGNWDEEAFKRLTQPLAAALSDLDGIMGCRFSVSSAGLKFDPRYISLNEVKAHVARVLTKASKGRRRRYFPYIGKKRLELTFRDR